MGRTSLEFICSSLSSSSSRSQQYVQSEMAMMLALIACGSHNKESLVQTEPDFEAL